jgi:hypothetical protein
MKQVAFLGHIIS